MRASDTRPPAAVARIPHGPVSRWYRRDGVVVSRGSPQYGSGGEAVVPRPDAVLAARPEVRSNVDVTVASAKSAVALLDIREPGSTELPAAIEPLDRRRVRWADR